MFLSYFKKISLINKNTYHFIKFLSLVLLALMMNLHALAQDTGNDTYENTSIKEHEFDKDNWERAVKGLDYSKNKKEEEEEEEPEDVTPPETNDFDWDGSIFDGNWSSFFKVFFFIIVIGLLAFIIIKMMGSTAFLSNKNVDKTALKYSIDKVEENIHEADLEDFARHALDKKDYKLAIRLYFLQILKHLSINNFIKWKRDKTNKEYVREMSGTDLFKEFRTISRLFERVWYSDVTVQEHQFNQIRPRFLDFFKESNEINKRRNSRKR